MISKTYSQCPSVHRPAQLSEVPSYIPRAPQQHLLGSLIVKDWAIRHIDLSYIWILSSYNRARRLYEALREVVNRQMGLKQLGSHKPHFCHPPTTFTTLYGGGDGVSTLHRGARGCRKVSYLNIGLQLRRWLSCTLRTSLQLYSRPTTPGI